MAWFSATFCLLSLSMLFSWVWASDPVEVAKFGLYRTASLDLDENGQADLFLENPPKDFGFGESVLRPRIFVEHISDTIVRVTIRDPESKRWEVPDIVQTPIKTRKTNAYLKVTLTSDNVTGTGFQVHRRLHGHFQTIFDAHGIVFADRFLRIRTHLPNNPYIYGLGERVTSLRLPVNQTFSIMATDQLTPSLKPLYGSHPFYMEVREGGIAHGVFALNSNPMEIDLDHNSLTYRFLGGIFDFYFMAGPKPKDVVEQYHAIIGRPSLPPSWHFGFHQCRWGYKDLQILENVISNYTYNGIPLDTIWNDLDYMDGYRIFTSDSERFPQTSFKEFLESLHSQKRHYIPIIDPGVKIDPGYQTYKEGVQENVFLPAVSNPFTDDKFFVGQVWPGLVHFPDWTHPNTTRWWSNQIQRFHQKVPIDGLWTDMNEAANFCDGRCVLSASKLFNGSNSDNCNFCGQVLDTNLYDHPWPKSVRDPLPDRPCHAAYRTSGLDCGSISMGVQHYNGAYEYDMHNLFGHMEAVATYKGLIDATGSRPVIVTRSTYPGSGRFATHWLGDNYSSFESMRQSIPGMLNMGLFGVSMVGADICGFAGDTTAELCIRWFQLGSFYPFARNHNILFSNVAQEAYAFGPDATDCIRTALILRYRLYYYIYSVAALAALNGGAIARPVMLEFPQDKLTWNIDEQFMLGSSLMICPQLYEGKDHVNCYLPPSALWYTLEGEMIESGDRFPSPLNATAPTFIQGGFIVPLSSSPGLTIADTRTSDFSLLIALDRKNRAIGSMYFDDGKSLNSIESQNYTLVEYSAHSDAWPKEGSKIQIQLALTRTNFPETVRLSEIQIFPKCAGAVKFSENRLNGQLSLSVNEPFVLQAFCLPEEPSFNLPAVAFE